MLENTFIHIQGIGPATEKKLWESNICQWADISGLSNTSLGKAKISQIETSTQEAKKHLLGKNPKYFEKVLPSNQHYRFFPEFRNTCAYIDIETTGLSTSSMITTIALYNGKEIQYFVQGKNLADFMDEILKYKILITYNGRSFDIPFIEEYFNTKLPHAQIDLRYILGHLGFKGGLKKCEKAMGIDREDLSGVDGYFAVILWQDYINNENEKALQTLLAYNIEDVINLEPLMIKAYNLHIKQTPFAASHTIEVPDSPTSPLKPDMETINRLKGYYHI